MDCLTGGRCAHCVFAQRPTLPEDVSNKDGIHVDTPLVCSVRPVPAAPCRSSGQTLTPRQIAERARPALVYVEALSGGTVAGTGSGVFVAANGTFITNFHIIEGADALRVRIHSGEVFDNLYLVSTDERRDLAILRVPETNVSFLPIGDDRALATGDPIWAWAIRSASRARSATGWSAGSDSRMASSTSRSVRRFRPAPRAGPVLNARAEVVGIATLWSRTGQNLNMAVPARYASGLLAWPVRRGPLPA